MQASRLAKIYDSCGCRHAARSSSSLRLTLLGSRSSSQRAPARLGFTLVAMGKGGVEHKELVIPLSLHVRQAASTVIADAGDYQLAVAGTQVTLNGIRSVPRDRLAYRWIQVDGPKVHAKVEDGWICVFVPEEPGLYRFLLVVAGDGAISEPSEVRVFAIEKGHSDGEKFSIAADSTGRGPGRANRIDHVEAMARESVKSLDGGPHLSPQLADAFSGVSERMSLYDSYQEVFSELSRRLEEVLPEDTEARTDWDRTVLEPLSAQVLRALKSEGLDLSRNGADAKRMTEAQKERLAATFQSIARGFKAAGGELPQPSAALGRR